VQRFGEHGAVNAIPGQGTSASSQGNASKRISSRNNASADLPGVVRSQSQTAKHDSPHGRKSKTTASTSAA
jgi:hypothetical protein